MNGRVPVDDLGYFLDEGVEQNCHLIIIGSQECSKSIKKNVMFPNKDEWEKMLVKFFDGKYTLLETETLTALHIAVFVLVGFQNYIKERHSSRIATGIGNMIGNKGAVSIALKLVFKNEEVSILFVNSHLSAHQNQIEERNTDFKRINKELKMDGFQKNEYRKPNITDRYDYVFWFGDLNYRINGNRPIIESLIKDNRLEVLLNNDQLLQELRKGNIFSGFWEGIIRFLPTFKLEVGTNNVGLSGQVNSSVGTSKDDTGLTTPVSINNASPIENKRKSHTESFENSPSPLISITHSLPNISEKAIPPSINLNIPATIPRAGSNSQMSTPMPTPISIGGSEGSSMPIYNAKRIPSWTDRILYKCRIEHEDDYKFESDDDLNDELGKWWKTNMRSQNAILKRGMNQDSSYLTDLSFDKLPNRGKGGGGGVTGIENSEEIFIVRNQLASPRPTAMVSVLQYTSVDKYTTSDHKPVFGVYDLRHEVCAEDGADERVVELRKNKKGCLIQ